MTRRVENLSGLRKLASRDPRYAPLAFDAVRNLGGDIKDLDGAMRWLEINATVAGDEMGVCSEVSFFDRVAGNICQRADSSDLPLRPAQAQPVPE